MSRYLLLLLLNLPFIVLAIVSTATRYKLGHATKHKTIIHFAIWFTILIGLIFAEPLYEWLLVKGYTNTNSLSLFDVLQITAIVTLLYITSRMRAKLDLLEQRLSSLHREISIRLSDKK